MNKRGVAILIIILALCAVSVVEQIFIENTLTKVTEKISILAEQVRTSDNMLDLDIRNSIDDLEHYWKVQENKLCTIIDHRNMKELGEFIIKTKTSINLNEKDETIKNIDLIKYYVEGYQHIMKINFQNIF